MHPALQTQSNTYGVIVVHQFSHNAIQDGGN